MIFGLGFATVITLLIVPVMMTMALSRKAKLQQRFKKN
jgi:multidrug efflux pump subunit AcrB